MARFILNHSNVETVEEEGSTLLDFIRYRKRLTGTKIGCREGDCGACTILVGDIENGQLVYRSMTSCLMPLANANGKHIVTVEGINMEDLSPVQQAMVNENGTQCGFCTLGFVMSLTGFVLNETKRYEQGIASIDGNICRCTGYKSIERATAVIAKAIQEKPEKARIDWLTKNKFIPQYFEKIEERLLSLNTTNANSPGIGSINIGGGTDLVVQKPLAIKRSKLNTVASGSSFKGIKKENNLIYTGGSVTVSEFAESAVIKEHFNDLPAIIKLVSSTPIRNMATMAGNLVNASPIGDMSIFFLALDASLELTSGADYRIVKLNEFYTAYKKTALEPNELISKIIFPAPQPGSFSFEKVSKRTHLDIASVNSACSLTKTKDGLIGSVYLSAGGVAPFPKFLKSTCDFLTGKKPGEEVLREAIIIINEEIAPISDARGTEQYKRMLLRQLFIAHMLKFFGPLDSIKKIIANED
jgi:xanthine dehydrogenase small subunit